MKLTLSFLGGQPGLAFCLIHDKSPITGNYIKYHFRKHSICNFVNIILFVVGVCVVVESSNVLGSSRGSQSKCRVTDLTDLTLGVLQL